MKRYQQIKESSCPFQTDMYGGIPTGGGYGSYTEYEIGAQRISEACHCILGSLGKIIRSDDYEQSKDREKGHIKEEFNIIEGDQKEYSMDLYLQDTYFGNKKYAQDSITSIIKASKDLLKIIPKRKKNIKHYTIEISLVAESCYDVLTAIANAMLESMYYYPDSKINAFGDVNLRAEIRKLKNNIRKMYK